MSHLTIKKTSKYNPIYEFSFNNHNFQIVKSDDNEWHLKLILKTKYDDTHFLNNYKTIKQIKYDFEKHIEQIQVFMNNLEDGLLMRNENKKNFYNFKVA